MFRRKETIYLVNYERKILGILKKPNMIPRKGEIMVIKPEEKKYQVIEIVYTLEKNSYICWVYLKEIK